MNDLTSINGNNSNINEASQGLVFKGVHNIETVADEIKCEISNILESSIGKTPKQIEDLIKKVSLGGKLETSEINAINHKIISNNPTLGILNTLNEGDEYMSIIFSGIKGVNDLFGQNFTDKILNIFKYNILKIYPEYKISWNDYKNLVIKTNNGNLPSNENLNLLLNNIYIKELNSEKYIPKEIPKLKCISKVDKIKGTTQKDIMYSLAETRSHLEGVMSNEKILNCNELIIKLEGLKTDYNYKGKINERIHDERGRTKYVTRKGILYKKYIISETGKTVIDKISILDIRGDINPKIIELVRKNKIPSNLQIFKDIDQIIKSTIVNGEFIGPYMKEESTNSTEIINPEELKGYKDIIYKLSKGIQLSIYELNILSQLTKKTYKNALDKETFGYKIKKPGELFFIDIAGMGNINIQDFINKIKKYTLGKISKKDLLLTSGSYMTENFQSLMKDLKTRLGKAYPLSRIHYYIGGDEIGIFIEGIQVSYSSTIRKIYDELENNLLEGRIIKSIITENDSKKGGKQLFNELDQLSKYSKILEERINEAEQRVKTEAILGKINNAADILWKINMLKDFDITKKGGELIIQFHPEDNELLFDGGNTLKLEQIIDYGSLRLRDSSVSPFIEYLINNNLKR